MFTIFIKMVALVKLNFYQDIKFLLVGSLIAFIVALLAIKSFITFLERKGFKIFGWYRIAAGIVIIILYYTGNALHTI
jgi:undecaprenyl-diphosphatase